MSGNNCLKLLYTEKTKHKIFLVNVQKLLHLQKIGSLKFYDKQRIINDRRVQEIISFQNMQIRKYGEPKIRGTIVFCQLSPDLITFDPIKKRPWFIIDGQHRLKALFQMVSNKIIDDAQILIELVEVNNKEEMFKEFQEINFSVPVPLHYLSPNELIDRGTNLLISKYCNAFSEKGIRPKISIDNFKNTLIDQNIIQTHNIKTPEDLVDIIEKINSYYGKIDKEKMCDLVGKNNKKERSTVEHCYCKCKEDPTKYLFIGIFKHNDWIIDIDYL